MFFDTFLCLRTLSTVSELPLFFKSRFYVFLLFNEPWCLFFRLLRCLEHFTIKEKLAGGGVGVDIPKPSRSEVFNPCNSYKWPLHFQTAACLLISSIVCRQQQRHLPFNRLSLSLSLSFSCRPLPSASHYNNDNVRHLEWQSVINHQGYDRPLWVQYHDNETVTSHNRTLVSDYWDRNSYWSLRNNVLNPTS